MCFLVFVFLLFVCFKRNLNDFKSLNLSRDKLLTKNFKEREKTSSQKVVCVVSRDLPRLLLPWHSPGFGGPRWSSQGLRTVRTQRK